MKKITIVQSFGNINNIYNKGEVITIENAIADTWISEGMAVETIEGNQTFSVASQAAMLATGATKGDIAIRSDINKSLRLMAEPATVVVNWKELLTPQNGKINIKDYGAVGNGVVDDTQSIKNAITYAATNGYTVYIPPGNYLVTSTIKVDLMKSNMIGESGSSNFVVNNTLYPFTGDSVINIVCSASTYTQMPQRLRIYGYFNVINNDNVKKTSLIGLKVNGTLGDADHGNMDGANLYNICIKNFDIGLMHEDSVYKYLFEHLHITQCNTEITIPRPLGDSGEGSVFSGCWLINGGGKLHINRATTFRGCSIHLTTDATNPGALFDGATCQIVFDACHFENISADTGATAFAEPWFDIVYSGATITLLNCEMLISGTGIKRLKDCLFRNRGTLKISNCHMRYLLPRLVYDEATLNPTHIIGSMVKNLEGGQSKIVDAGWVGAYDNNVCTPIVNSSKFTDYSFSILTTSDIPTVFRLKALEGSKFADVFSDATVTTTFTIETLGTSVVGTKALKGHIVSTNASARYISLGVPLTIPDYATTVQVSSRARKNGSVNINSDNNNFQFFDESGIKIPTADVLALNNAISLYSSQTTNDTWYTSTGHKSYRKIPPNAKYVIASPCIFEIPANATGDIWYDYLYINFL